MSKTCPENVPGQKPVKRHVHEMSSKCPQNVPGHFGDNSVRLRARQCVKRARRSLPSTLRMPVHSRTTLWDLQKWTRNDLAPKVFRMSLLRPLFSMVVGDLPEWVSRLLSFGMGEGWGSRFGGWDSRFWGWASRFWGWGSRF